MGEVNKPELGGLQRQAGKAGQWLPVSGPLPWAQGTEHQAMGDWSKTVTPSGTCCWGSDLPWTKLLSNHHLFYDCNKIPKVVNLGGIKGYFGPPFWSIWDELSCVVQGRSSLVLQVLVEWEIFK